VSVVGSRQRCSIIHLTSTLTDTELKERIDAFLIERRNKRAAPSVFEEAVVKMDTD
jgi:hypothetical protein